MKIIHLFIALSQVFMACAMNKGVDSAGTLNEIPVVKSDSTYNVLVKHDIVYAEALSHESLNSKIAKTIPLKLDVYFPDNTVKNRPVFLFIHGGGFAGGSKQQDRIINFANYYTSRGWVFISIDYRLKKHKGTVPREWINYSERLPERTRVGRFIAIYPAHRDAKAALRWIVANADSYNINPNHITVGGSSAGAITAISSGISNVEDFRDEISLKQDPTLRTTNMKQEYHVRTIVDLWGSKAALDALEKIFGHQRFNENNPSLFVAHGTEDLKVPYSRAVDLKAIYEATGVPLAYYPLEGKKHGAWDATVNNKRLEELAFDFIVEQQKITVE